MDTVQLLKFLHIVMAILWLGGGMCMILLAAFLGRNPAPERLMPLVRQITVYAPRVFVPGSMMVLVTGVAMVWIAGYGWPAWIVLGLAGVAFGGVFGSGVLGPMATRAVVAADARGDAAGAGEGMRLLQLAKFDFSVQFAVVFLMVIKPDWGDTLPLAMAALAVLAGAALFLRPGPVAA
jgi:uncharacterized membrane protein